MSGKVKPLTPSEGQTGGGANLAPACVSDGKLRLTLSLRVSGPGLPESLKCTNQSFCLQRLLLHIAIVFVLLA